MEFSQILYAKENRVAIVTLNRPEKLNAYSETMVHETLAALADARDDDEVRAVIITGAASVRAGTSRAISSTRRGIAATGWNRSSRCARTFTSS
jgi:1,4-dihydroxy-2-naphthoyl-CoA synthase